MSKINNHQLIMRACTSLAGATLCATIFLTTNTNNVSASSMPLPIQSNIEKNIDNANQVINSKNKLQGRRISGGSDWIYTYADNGELIIGDTELKSPIPIYESFHSVADQITKITFLKPVTFSGDLSEVFSNLPNLTTIQFNGVDTKQVTNMRQMFANDTSLTDVKADLLDTENVTDMSYMFSECSSLTNKLDVSGFNTHNVTNMSAMFADCSSLTKLDVSKWDVSNMAETDFMFFNCSSLTKLDVSQWHTKMLHGAHGMFSGCEKLNEIDISNWTTDGLGTAERMFENCSSLTKLDLSNFDDEMMKLGSRANYSNMLRGLDNLQQLKIGKTLNLQYTNLDVPATWVSVGTGTIKRPAGTEHYSSDDLAKFWNDKDYTETWVRNVKYNVTINYVDLDNNNKIIKTDSISSDNLQPIDYKSAFDKIVADLKTKKYDYVASKDELPWSNGKVQLPDNSSTDVTYTVGFKHATCTVKDGDKNPVTGEDIPNLSKIVKQSVHYQGAYNTLPDNNQAVTFTRSAQVDLITGKVKYLDWNESEQTFKDVDSPIITGYTPDIATVKGATVTPESDYIFKVVTYSRSNYKITIKYIDIDDNNKVIKTDTVNGNPEKVIAYQDQMNNIVKSLAGYVVTKQNTSLPLDDDGNIQLPNDILSDTEYQVGLKHNSKDVHAGDKNPVTGNKIDGLTKTVTQTIKYTGMPNAIDDNIQKLTFTRNATVDMVTGKVTYLDWDSSSQSFKDVTSPTVKGYNPDIATVKGATVKPTDSDITKEVKYARGNYKIAINYVDTDDNDKVVKTDTVNGNPEKVIVYKDQMDSIVKSLAGYVLNKEKTNLPLDSDGNIKLPDDTLNDMKYQVGLKHDSKTIHAGDKNPVTGDKIDGLSKAVTQTIKYTGTPTAIADNVQKVTFKRNADVDMVTGKLTYHDWDNKELVFKDVDSPKVTGYEPDNTTVKGAAVKPTDSDVTKEVKYSRSNYSITINYVDSNDNDKVIKTDKVSGNPDKVISYQDQLKQILHDLLGYVINKDKTTLPLDNNNDIKLPDNVIGNKDYQVVLKHDSKTMHAGDKNPVTGKDEDSLTKTITQTIKYAGAPSEIADNVQKVTFKRDADVDMVTGKLAYHDWDSKEHTFNDTPSPIVTGYDANPSSVKGETVTPDSSDITKTVAYVRSNYGIKINYVDGDDNNTILKTDTIEGNPEKAIAYKDKMNSIISSLTGYVLNKIKTDLPLNENGDVQLPPDVLGNKTYNVVLNHKTGTMNPGDKNPVTGKEESGLTKVVTRTIKYTGIPNNINDKVQRITFIRNATVDLVTGKLTYLDWDKDSQTLAEVVSPKVAGYIADPETVKAQTVKPDDNDTTVTVKYARGSYDVNINYVDSNTGKIVKTDKVSGNPDKVISYQDQIKQIMQDLPSYVIDKDKTTLPLDGNNDIKLSASVIGDKDYQVVLKHDSKTIHAGDKNPVTGKNEDGLTKTITQTIKYTGVPNAIADNVQKVTFERSADVDMVTGKLTYHDWNKESQTFADITSPAVDGYDADILVVKGTTIKPTDSDITKTVTYTKKETPSYEITINYQDDTGKVVKTDKQKGKAGTTVQYHDKLQEIINQIGNSKYEIDKDKSNLPLDKNDDIKLPADLTADKDYQVVLKHKIVTIKPGDKNPVTNELITGLTKDVKQTIKYAGANKDISDNVQAVKFTRNGQVDLVTGKITYLEWNEKEQSFKDVDSPAVSGYTPDIATVEGGKVTANSSNITKQVTYTKNKQDNTDNIEPEYEITIDYQDENGKTIKTDKQKGKANSTIPYKDRMKEIINTIVKNGYEVDWSKSNLPVDGDGNIKLGLITGDTNYKLVLKHKMVTFKYGEKNPFTNKEDPNLEHKVTQTIKYLNSKQNLPNNIQTLIFTRDAQVDMITGKVKYLDWNESGQTFKDVKSPFVKGYVADLPVAKGRTVTGNSKNIVQLVTYNKSKVVQTGLNLMRNKQSTILGTIIAAFAGILSYFGIIKKKGKKD